MPVPIKKALGTDVMESIQFDNTTSGRKAL